MKENNTVNEQILSEHLAQLIDLTHKVLQDNKNLSYKCKYDQDLHIVCENELPIVSYGGKWTPNKKYWPEIIRIYPKLGQRIYNDLNYEIRLDSRSNYGNVEPDSFSLKYYPDQGAAYGTIPDSECIKIRTEIFNISQTCKRTKVR